MALTTMLMPSRWDDDVTTLSAHPLRMIEDSALDTTSDNLLIANECAIHTIRAFRNDSMLTVSILGISANPYHNAGLLTIYVDNHGYEYWFDPDDDVLVQVHRRTRDHTTSRKTLPDDNLTVSELRDLALTLLERILPKFTEQRQGLHPLEANREHIIFFRWDNPNPPTKESEYPPFLQIGLFRNGELASYTNTLKC